MSLVLTVGRTNGVILQYKGEISCKWGTCEQWVQAIEVGDVVSRYRFLLTRGKDGTPVPRMYEMKGYDNLIGSHYDKYVLHYLEFDQNKPDSTCKCSSPNRK